MPERKFKPGDLVTFAHGSRTRSPGEYVIVRVLPGEDGERRYQVRSAHETHERMAAEHELRLVRTAG